MKKAIKLLGFPRGTNQGEHLERGKNEKTNRENK
jgi:hypothetical protein